MENATGAQFPPTRWSLIIQAGSQADPGARRAALEEICRSYWRPLYAFARRKGCPPPDAEDATQNFLARLLEDGALISADSTQGSLRTFLLTRLQTFLVDTWRRENALKRGGGAVHLPLDFHEAEERCGTEWHAATSPGAAFDRQWVSSLLESVLLRVQQDYESSGRGRQFEVLRTFLNFDDTPSDCLTAAETLSISPAAARQAIHRLRERFTRELRTRVAETLPSPTEEAIDEELGALRAALTS